MTTKWNGPPVPIGNRRAGKLLRFGDQNFPDSTPRRRKLASGPLPLGPGDEARLEALAALCTTTATASGPTFAVIEGGRP